jgi:hypothetical protein
MKMEFKSNGLMSPKVIALALAALLIFPVSFALGQGTTAFTYQGQLLNSGTNVNGANVMVFTLYSAATSNTAIATPITNSVSVSNGLFTVDLNFGAAPFNGNACWLGIAVSNGMTNVELSPRLQVLPTPYATYAASAASAATAAYAGSATNFVGGSVFAGSFIGNGGGLTNVGVSLQMEVFPNPGTFTFTVPTNVSSVIVEAWGGGGGGGAGNSSEDTAGGGGGAGGYAKGVVSVTPGAGYAVAVGTDGVAGGGGGTSSFGGTLIVAIGGQGGASDSSGDLTAGGAGGSGGQRGWFRHLEHQRRRGTIRFRGTRRRKWRQRRSRRRGWPEKRGSRLNGWKCPGRRRGRRPFYRWRRLRRRRWGSDRVLLKI